MEIGSLDKLKKDYEKLKKKYLLPSFDELNEDFDIEELQDIESDFLLKRIRRKIMNRIESYLRVTELFMNPSNAPMFFLALSKNLTQGEKDTIERIYLKLGKFEIKNFELDNNHEEEKEAECIKDLYEEWKVVKQEFGDFLKELEQAWDRKVEEGNKGYLG